MAELRRQVNALMGGETPVSRTGSGYVSADDLTFVEKSLNSPATITISAKKATDDCDYQDTEEYVEEALSIEETEKELIRKALLRNHGKRKAAAQELKISERTLYRKIQKYNLEDY